MSDQGYVIRPEHVEAAIVKATAAELPELERFLELVTELNDLTSSLPARVAKAKADAGIPAETLSRAADEAIAQSGDAWRDVDRILTRKCNRAESAAAVAREILAIAKIDMKAANTMDNWIPEDSPTKPIYSELYWKSRKLVEGLRRFIATESE